MMTHKDCIAPIFKSCEIVAFTWVWTSRLCAVNFSYQADLGDLFSDNKSHHRGTIVNRLGGHCKKFNSDKT